jgi:hypothetical protein
LSIAITEVVSPEWVYLMPHQVEHALDGAILAGGAVERVEHQIGLRLVQPERDVAVHVDPGDLVAEIGQCVGDAVAADQRHLALGRPLPRS